MCWEGSLGVMWCAAVASDPLLCREVVALCPRVCTVCAPWVHRLFVGCFGVAPVSAAVLAVESAGLHVMVLASELLYV